MTSDSGQADVCHVPDPKATNAVEWGLISHADAALTSHLQSETMKRISTLLSLGVLVALSATLVSNSNGVAHQQNKDRTGAPGSDATCQQCHAGGSYAPTVEVDLAISDMVGVPEYTPGATHTIWITVAGSGNPAGFGVHGTAVLENGANAGTFTDQASDDCIYLDQVEGRHIFEQNDLCEDGFFMVEWTAPPAGSGPVSVYVAAIAANGNSQSSGDNFVGTQVDFQEASSTSVAEAKPSRVQALGLGEGQLNVTGLESMRCAVFTMDGRILFDGDLEPGMQSLYLGHSGWVVVRCISQTGQDWTSRVLMPK